MAGLGPFEPRRASPRQYRAVPTAWHWHCLRTGGRGRAEAHCWRSSSTTGCVQSPGARPRRRSARLGARGIAARLLRLEGLGHGTALAERARDARFRVLTGACASRGYSASAAGAPRRRPGGDRADARARGQWSGRHGRHVALGRDSVDRAFCVRCWRFRRHDCARRWFRRGWRGSRIPPMPIRSRLRPRLRMLRLDRDGAGAATGALVAAAAASGRSGPAMMRDRGRSGGARVLRPEGFALLPSAGLRRRRWRQ